LQYGKKSRRKWMMSEEGCFFSTFIENIRYRSVPDAIDCGDTVHAINAKLADEKNPRHVGDFFFI